MSNNAALFMAFVYIKKSQQCPLLPIMLLLAAIYRNDHIQSSMRGEENGAKIIPSVKVITEKYSDIIDNQRVCTLKTIFLVEKPKARTCPRHRKIRENPRIRTPHCSLDKGAPLSLVGSYARPPISAVGIRS